MTEYCSRRRIEGLSPGLVGSERWRDTALNWAADAWCGSERNRDRRDDLNVFEPNQPRQTATTLFHLDQMPPHQTGQRDEWSEVRELRSLGIGNVSARKAPRLPQPTSPPALVHATAIALADRGQACNTSMQTINEISGQSAAAADGRCVPDRPRHDVSWVTGPVTREVRARSEGNRMASKAQTGTIALEHLHPTSQQNISLRLRTYTRPSGAWAW